MKHLLTQHFRQEGCDDDGDCSMNELCVPKQESDAWIRRQYILFSHLEFWICCCFGWTFYQPEVSE